MSFGKGLNQCNLVKQKLEKQVIFILSGVGATCVLKSAFNSTLDADIFRNFNVSHHTLQLLSKYYEDGCQRVFVPGIHLENYVPAADVIPNLPEEDSDNTRPTCKCLFVWH